MCFYTHYLNDNNYQNLIFSNLTSIRSLLSLLNLSTSHSIFQNISVQPASIVCRLPSKKALRICKLPNGSGILQQNTILMLLCSFVYCMKWEGICDVKNVSRLGFDIFVQWETFENYLPFCKTRDLWEKQEPNGLYS